MPDLLRAPRASTVDVLVAPKPFEPRLEVLSVEEGVTLAQLLTRACRSGALAVQDLPRTEIYIDGLRVADRTALRTIVPRVGEVVNIVVLPQGGGGHGKKNPLEMVLQIAVMVAAFAIAGPAGSPLAAALAAGTGVAGAGFIEVAAMAAINAVGSLALHAIFGSSSASDQAAKPQYSLDNQSNQSRLRQMMPLCAGQRRWSFDVVGTAFSTIVGADTYMTVMYGLHYGPCTLDGLKIGETLATAYPADELQTELFLTPGPRASKLYPSRIDQATLQNELDPLHADWSTATSGIEATRLEIDLYWPQLIYTSSGGEQKNQDSVVYMQYSPFGANQWQPVPGYPAGSDADHNPYPAGSLWISGKTTNPTRRTVGWDVPLGQYDVRIGRRIRRGGDTTRSVDDVSWTALRTINTAQPAIADENLAVLVIKAKASQDFSGSLGVVSGVVTPIIPVFDAASGWTGDPATYDAGTWKPSSNAAAFARYMLTGYPAASPLAASQIDASLGEHYATIEANGWTGGILLNSDTSQEDALVKLGKLGRCFFHWNGRALCCSPDGLKDGPRQMFTGRNAKDYQYKRVFPDPLHAVYVQFASADEDWKEAGLFVYADGFDAASAKLIESLQLDYACDTDRAKREGRVYLAKRQLLSETHQWTAGVDSMASTFGDRVAVRHISTLFGVGEARVQFRRRQGALISGVRLDTAVTLQAGQTYTIDARRPDQVIRGLPIITTQGQTRDLVFAVPVAEADAPLKGDLIVVGQTGQVTEDVEIIDITPKPDGTADILAQSYRAADILAAEMGPIAALQTALTARVPAPVPVILGANGDPNGVVVAFDVVPQRQAPIAGFSARWRRSPDEVATSTWNTLPTRSALDRTVQTPPLTDAQVLAGGTAEPYKVDVEIRTILATGEVSQPAQALNIVVQKGVLAPTNFAALGVARTAQDGSSYPAIQVDCDPLIAGSTDSLVVELQLTGANPPAWRASASGPFAADVADGDLTDVASGSAYDVRARWRTADGWYSDYVLQLDVPVPDGSLVACDVVALGGRGAAQVLADADAAAAQVAQHSQQLIDQGDAQVAAAMQAMDQLLQAHRSTFDPDGLPLGPTLKQTNAVLSDQVSLMSLIAVRSADGLAALLNTSTVQVSPDGTTLAQQLFELAAATGDVAANLQQNYLDTTDTHAAIAAASLTLSGQIGGLKSTLEDDYYTSAQTDLTVSLHYLSLQSYVDDGVNADLHQNYSTTASMTDAISQAKTDLGSQIGGVKSELEDDYYTASQVDFTVSLHYLSMQSYVDHGVTADLHQNYMTAAQTGQAISQATLSLTAANSGDLGAHVTEQATAIDVLHGLIAGTLLFEVGEAGSVTSLSLVNSAGGGSAPLSEILIRCDDFILTDGAGRALFSVDAATNTARIGTNVDIAGSLNVAGGVDSGAFLGGAVSTLGYQVTTPSSPQPVPQLASSSSPPPSGSGGGSGGGGGGGGGHGSVQS